MGNCCTGSATTDHPFTPDKLSLPSPQTAFTNSSPALSSSIAAITASGGHTAPGMMSSFMGVGVIEVTDSTMERVSDAVVHMADREGKILAVQWNPSKPNTIGTD